MEKQLLPQDKPSTVTENPLSEADKNSSDQQEAEHEHGKEYSPVGLTLLFCTFLGLLVFLALLLVTLIWWLKHDRK